MSRIRTIKPIVQLSPKARATYVDIRKEANAKGTVAESRLPSLPRLAVAELIRAKLISCCYWSGRHYFRVR